MSATPARLAALRVLRRVRTGGLADSALHAELDALPHRDRAWTSELVRGTLRLRGRLDHVLRQFTRRPLDRLDGDVLDVLRLGAYQLLAMDGVPAWAAVSQSVDLARNSRGGDRLVNAVLRAVQRAGGDVSFPAFDADPVGWLTTWGSHPAWLVERWIERFGADATRRLVEMNNDRPPLYLRPVRDDVAAAREKLRAAGIETAAVDGEPHAIRLEPGADVSAALGAVPAVIQDPAAGRVADYAGPVRGVLVDLCAAPGGKAITLAAASGTTPASGGYVVAADLSPARIGRISENAGRLAPLPMGIVAADGRRPPFRPVGSVLVDAPCTGTGTLRRHADARWRVRPADLTALVELQAELLDGAAGIVRPGGTLVYATCSIEREENDEQIDAFLERHPEFEVEPVSAEPDARTGIEADGRLRLLPHVHGFDGAFAARVRRRR